MLEADRCQEPRVSDSGQTGVFQSGVITLLMSQPSVPLSEGFPVANNLHPSVCEQQAW